MLFFYIDLQRWNLEGKDEKRYSKKNVAERKSLKLLDMRKIISEKRQTISRTDNM